MATGTFTHSSNLAHENLNNVHKNVQKSYRISKPSIQNVLRTRTNVVKNWLSLYLVGCVRFARYCGKMYSRHLFSYSGLSFLPVVTRLRAEANNLTVAISWARLISPGMTWPLGRRFLDDCGD